LEKVIVYTLEAEKYLKELIDVLFENEYFSFRDDSVEYVLKIRDYVRQNITYPAKKTPIKFREHGEKYMFYKANNNTTWYIFFNQDEQRFVVKFITNNHTDFIANFNL